MLIAIKTEVLDYLLHLANKSHAIYVKPCLLSV